MSHLTSLSALVTDHICIPGQLSGTMWSRRDGFFVSILTSGKRQGSYALPITVMEEV